jgi:hypothetical protein
MRSVQSGDEHLDRGAGGAGGRLRRVIVSQRRSRSCQRCQRGPLRRVPQNRASGEFFAPHEGHRAPSPDPHEVQYRWSATFIAEHDGQTDPATVRRV